MASFSLFKLEKLKIKAYKKAERSTSYVDSFEVMFNPESYSASFKNVFGGPPAVGSSGKEAKYSLSRNSRMSFKFIFDGTGVSEFGVVNSLKGRDVDSRVKKFLELTTTLSGKIHEPYFLVIAWGNLNFKCRLEDVQISYTLFDESGIPLRAELDTTFVRDVETSERLKEDDLTSPDLTHKRIVKAYDTLPMMCEEIYGSESYYLKVAKANKLDDFRNLTPGQELFFPPIEK